MIRIGMVVLSPSDWMINLILIPLIAIFVGRVLSSGLGDEKRKVVGGAALLIGTLLFIYGVSSINSVSSEMLAMVGRVDIGGYAAIGFGELAGVVGIVVLLSKSRSVKRQLPSTRKCPFCAETIQAEAKLCRFCGKAVESASLT